MGVLISKFRKKKTTNELLESLDEQIKEIEEYKNNTELQGKRLVARLVLYSIGLYIIISLLFYFFFFPANLSDQIIYIIPLLMFPLLVIIVKRLLGWYYNRKIQKNRSELFRMKQEKKKLLEQVMDTETYKVAKEILEKYAPEQLSKSNTQDNETPSKQTYALAKLRQRNASSPPSSLSSSDPLLSSGAKPMLSSTKTPMPYHLSQASNTPLVSMSMPRVSQIATPMLQQGGAVVTPGPNYLPMPRAILPRERNVFDKMVEYLVGDGPSNRFALICKNCNSHNGMALREEFEYITFRCCYCYTINPARKLRPTAPKLELNSASKFAQLEDKSTSESERNSPSDSDGSESDHEKLKPPAENSNEESSKMEVDDVENKKDN